LSRSQTIEYMSCTYAALRLSLSRKEGGQYSTIASSVSLESYVRPSTTYEITAMTNPWLVVVVVKHMTRDVLSMNSEYRTAFDALLAAVKIKSPGRMVYMGTRTETIILAIQRRAFGGNNTICWSYVFS